MEVVKRGVIIAFLGSLLISFLWRSKIVSADYLEKGQSRNYYFQDRRMRLLLRGGEGYTQFFLPAFKKDDVLQVVFESEKYFHLKISRIRLFYPDGRLYAISKLEKVVPVNKRENRYQSLIPLKKRFKFLIIELELRPLRRRSNLKDVFYFQTMIANPNLDQSSLHLERLIYHPGERVELEWSAKKEVGKLRLNLGDSYKKRLLINPFSYQYDALRKKSRLSFTFPPLNRSGWYSLQIDSFLGKDKKIIVLPLYLNLDKPVLTINQPQEGELINEDLVAVKGKLKSALNGRLEAWFKKDKSQWQIIHFNFTLDKTVFNGLFFNWLTKDLTNGIYDLKLRWQDLSGYSIQKIIKGLKRDINPGFLGLKVVKSFHFPDIIVSTFDQEVSGYLAPYRTNSGLEIADNRFGCPGWTVTARVSDLYSPVSDSFISISNHLLLEPGLIKAVNGKREGVITGRPVIVSSPMTAVLISKAQPGYGCGLYTQNLFFRLVVPANTPAGDYRGKITFTIQ